MIESETAKTAAYQSQDCSNSVDMAMKRLRLRGCGDLISAETDGSNPNAGAPADGSCSVYHPNGGGAKPCNIAVAVADPCKTGPVGTVCTADGAIYIGDVSGNRIYIAPATQPGTYQWKTTVTETPGTNSTSDGLANTNAMIAAGINNHPAAKACNGRPPSGVWYLPAPDEFSLLLSGMQLSPIVSFISMPSAYSYWASMATYSGSSLQIRNLSYIPMMGGLWGMGTYYAGSMQSFNVVCVRRDLP